MLQKILLFALVLHILNPIFLYPQNQTGQPSGRKEIKSIPINGFCKYKNFLTVNNYTSIFAFNYNMDSYSDILLYSPLQRKINILTGNENGEFSRDDSIIIPYQLSKVESIFKNKKETGEYAFSSRRDRAAGIFNVSPEGKFSMESFFQFNSYPENISLADVNNDGVKEILISGSAFDGLSLLFRKNKRLLEKKIEERSVYSEAVFVDLNNDYIPDIAGYDLIKNSLNLFYNSGKAEFRKVRSVPVDGKINSLESFDMNSDSYEDLIFAGYNSITLLYNDFKSSFENRKTIQTLYHPDKIITGDFNKDGRIDIAYINLDQEILSVIFARPDNNFYPEIIYLKQNGLEDIIPFYSKFINGIAAISSKGELFTITRLSSFSEDSEAVFGTAPQSITFFDFEDNGIIDLCFLDNFSNSLISILRNNAGIPYYYYSFPLLENHSDLFAYDISPYVKGFYCYSSGEKLIEAVVVDYRKGEVERKSIYSHGSISELKVKRDSEDKINILSAYRIYNNAGLDIFKYSSHNYLNENYEIKVNDLISNVTLGNGKSIYFWRKAGRTLKFCLVDFDKDVNELKQKFSLFLQNETPAVSVFTSDIINTDKAASISFLTSRKDTSAVVCNDRSFAIIKKNDNTGTLDISNKRKLFFGEVRFNGPKKLSIFYPGTNSIAYISFLNDGKNFISSTICSAPGLNSFFIKNMNFQNYHIVYTKDNSSVISFIKIP